MGRLLFLLSFGIGLTAMGCRSENATATQPDFVGTSSTESSGQTRGSSSSETGQVGIDLIEDILFRAQRDGWTMVDPQVHMSVDKLRQAGMGLVLAALPASERPGVAQLWAQMDEMEKLIAQTQGAASLVFNLEDALELSRKGRIAIALLLEGAEALQGELERLPELKARGLWAVGIASPRGNAFADAAIAPREASGLTKAGRELLRALVDAGIAVDLTHASKDAFWEALCTAGTPIAVTHTASAALMTAPRNLDDLQVIALAMTGGLVGLVLNPEFLKPGATGTRAGIDDVVAHLVRWRDIGAESAIALGTDYGGVFPPKGLEDVSKLPALATALRERGWSDAEVSAFWGGNARRFLSRALLPGGSALAAEPLHPISIECDFAVGETSGHLSAACDGFVLSTGPTFSAEAKLRLRVSDMRSEPVRLELYGDAGTLWQVEAQDVDGRPLATRLLQLDEAGKGSVPLPSGRGMARVFVSPTRVASLREAVVWGRWPGGTDKAN